MKSLLSLFLVLVTFHFAGAQALPVPSGVQAEVIGTYDLERLQTILTTELKEFSDFSVQYPAPKYPVKLYRITYPSIIPEQQNRPTMASGLIAVPQGVEGALPVVSYQHGTVFTKTAVPSRPEESAETRLMIANFAAQGYILIAADYFGKGDSTETDSYLVIDSTRQACLDNLKAAQAVSRALNLTWGPLFLSGWSQGGWATLAFINKLESVGIPVAGAGAASAPGDVYATANGWIHAPREIDASYIPAVLCIQLYALSHYHGLPGLPEAAIRPEYLETARDFYLNKIPWEDAYAKLPQKPKDLYREEFLKVNAPESARYWELLTNSQSYRRRSITPLRVYSGQIDEVVSSYIATLPVGFQEATGGAKAVAVDAGEKATHRGTFLYGMADQQKWFAELRETAATTPEAGNGESSPAATPSATPASTPKAKGSSPSAP